MLNKNTVIHTDGMHPCIITKNTIGTNQVTLHERLTIPAEKPDVEQVNEVIISSEIVETKAVLIKDLRCDQILIKVIVKGHLHEKFVYTACRPEQPVHTAEFTTPFYGHVVLDFDIKKANCCLSSVAFLEKLLHVNVCIEDVTVQLVNGRTIDKFVTALLSVSGDIDQIVDSI